MTVSTESDLKNFLKSIDLPDVGQSIGDVGRVLGVSNTDGHILAEVELGFPAGGAHDSYRSLISEAIRAETTCKDVTVEISTKVVAHGVQRNLQPLEQIRNLIAVRFGNRRRGVRVDQGRQRRLWVLLHVARQLGA